MSFQLQKQLKENAEDIRNYVSDLYNWEEEMNEKKKESNLQQNQQKVNTAPIRGKVEDSEVSQKLAQQQPDQQQTNNETQSLYRRDKTTIPNYYKAWDKFDIDEQLKKVDTEDTQQEKPKFVNPYLEAGKKVMAKAQTKIQVKGGRTAQQDANSLKDKGNLYFKSLEYEKAIEQYTLCIDKLIQANSLSEDEKLLLSIVYSNRAMGYINIQEYSKAVDDCTNSLKYNNKNEKSYFRKGQAYKKMKKYHQALQEFQKAKEINQSSEEIDSEIQVIRQKLTVIKEEAYKNMMIPPGYMYENEEFQKIEVKDVDIEDNEQNPQLSYFNSTEFQKQIGQKNEECNQHSQKQEEEKSQQKIFSQDKLESSTYSQKSEQDEKSSSEQLLHKFENIHKIDIYHKHQETKDEEQVPQFQKIKFDSNVEVKLESDLKLQKLDMEEVPTKCILKHEQPNPSYEYKNLHNIDGKLQKHSQDYQQGQNDESKKINFGEKQLIEEEKAPKHDYHKEVKPEKSILKKSDDIDPNDLVEYNQIFNVKKLHNIDGKVMHASQELNQVPDKIISTEEEKKQSNLQEVEENKQNIIKFKVEDHQGTDKPCQYEKDRRPRKSILKHKDENPIKLEKELTKPEDSLQKGSDSQHNTKN